MSYGHENMYSGTLGRALGNESNIFMGATNRWFRPKVAAKQPTERTDAFPDAYWFSQIGRDRNIT
jgi:hypothetical protein